MNDVKLGNIDLARTARQPASAPQTKSRQVEAYSVDQGSGSEPKKSVEQQEMETVRAAIQSRKADKEKTEQMQEAVTRLNDYVQSTQRDLQFTLDNESGRTVVTVLDRNTNEVVRQIPDDVALKLARNLQQDEPLSLFNVKV
ncbi:MAG: flagellar protein FlaG [Hahellaceae bacterium]|nr:flagellar protein FlaG [Hahellaceae bacterium]